jgi:hypothetical protein
VLSADSKPTASMYLSFGSLSERIDVWINRWKDLLKTKVSELNTMAGNSTRSAVEIRGN